MHRLARLTVAVALALAGTIGAQTHDLGYICGGTGGRLYVVDGSGNTRQARIATQPLYGLTMNSENRTVIVAHLSGELLRIDPESFTVIGTIFAGAPLSAIRDVTIDHNGDYFVTDSNANGIFRVSNGVLSTVIIDGARLTSPQGGLRIDALSGDLLVMDVAMNDTLYRVARDGSSIATVGTGFNGRYGFAQHIPTGEIYSGSGGGFNGSIQMLEPRVGVATAFETYQTPSEMLAITMDRSSAVTPRMIGTGSGVNGGIWLVDYVTKAATSVTLFHQNAYEVDFLYGRNLQSTRLEAGHWELQVSFPDSVGYGVAVLASLAGWSPGLQLPDGRSVNLAPDPLFFRTLTGGYAPYITGNHAFLDLAGSARVQVDVRSLGTAVEGQIVWFCAVVVDPEAPTGVRTVSDPYPVVLEDL